MLKLMTLLVSVVTFLIGCATTTNGTNAQVKNALAQAEPARDSTSSRLQDQPAW